MTATGANQHTAGELWARHQLARLRAAHFSPAATGRFLLASQRRANDVRRNRPDLARRSRQWMALGATGWLVAALNGRGPFRRRLIAGLGWWGAVAVMLDWHLGMFETETGRPRNLGPADALTLTRAWLVPVLADGLYPATVTVVIATDAIDGPVARATASTRAGRDLERLVDAAAMAAALLGARRRDQLMQYAVVLEMTRISAGFAYATLVYLGRAQAPNAIVARAARPSSPLRAAGLLLAARGNRRSASAAMIAGSLLGIVAITEPVLQHRTNTPQPTERTSTPFQNAT